MPHIFPPRAHGRRVYRLAAPVRYVLSAVLFLAAFLIRVAIDSALPPGFPYLTFFPAVVIATYFLGTGPGVLCAVLSFFAAWYAFIQPFYSFEVNGQTLIALAFFVFIVVVDIVLIDRMLNAGAALKAEKAKAVTLAEQRDDLFSELQHRVGNNLAMVSAMLKVQARALPQAEARSALENASRRLSIIAEVNRLFHNPSHSLNRIDGSFLESLCRKCLEANGAEGRIGVSATATPIELEQERFLPVALIVAESINNAVEHGFGAEGRGRIVLTGAQAGDMYRIDIADDGAGLPPGFDLASVDSVGLKLVRSFVRQVDGSYAVAPGAAKGAVSTVVFPLPGAGQAAGGV